MSFLSPSLRYASCPSLKTVMNLIDRMGGNQFRKLVESIKQNGLQDKVINFVKIGDENYVVLGNNRLQAVSGRIKLSHLGSLQTEPPLAGLL